MNSALCRMKELKAKSCYKFFKWVFFIGIHLVFSKNIIQIIIEEHAYFIAVSWRKYVVKYNYSFSWQYHKEMKQIINGSILNWILTKVLCQILIGKWKYDYSKFYFVKWWNLEVVTLSMYQTLSNLKPLTIKFK